MSQLELAILEPLVDFLSAQKNIMYWFPSVDADARAALIRLREIAETGQIKPVVKRVYKFEDGTKAFQGPSEQAVVMLLDQEKLINGDTS